MQDDPIRIAENIGTMSRNIISFLKIVNDESVPCRTRNNINHMLAAELTNVHNLLHNAYATGKDIMLNGFSSKIPY
jgi:hypothetical protein